jgi:cytosine/adenosine deaminase-related metal-dependent hydrolase
MQWMRSHDGPLHDLLVEFGAWDETTTSVGPRPLDYLQRLTKAHRALVVHGNYLDDEEIAFCGAHADSMAVVFCPRTHARFGHAPYPLAKMLAAGVCVALGTDSRASNPDLSLLGEMKQIAATHRDVSPETILSLGTLAGALALGRADQIGSLAVGKLANLAIIELPGDAQSNDPSALFAADSTGIATVVRGEIVYDPQNRFARQSPR